MYERQKPLSERSLTIRLNTPRFHLYEISGKGKTIEIEDRSVAARGWEWD